MVRMTFTFPDYTKLQSQAYHSGARISNNSWGNQDNFGGQYDCHRAKL